MAVSNNGTRHSSLINQLNRAQIDHPEPKTNERKEATAEDLLALANQEKLQAVLKGKTARYRKYAMSKVPKIFNPDQYQKDVGGQIPTESPLLAALHSVTQKTSYLTPLPAMAYERQIDVDSKYVREGQYNYGAQ